MNMHRLENSPSLAEQAYGVLKEAIQSLELEPGQEICLQELADQLGVSRTPIRTALNRLESDGLVSSDRHKRGMYVTMLTREDIEEILEIRGLLEGHAVRVVVGELSGEELDEAEAIVKRQQDLFAQGQVLEARVVGHQFHALLLKKVRNRRIVGILQQLDTQYKRFRRHLAKVRALEQRSVDDHLRILSALRARDAEAASKAMVEHLDWVKGDMLSAVLPDEESETSALLGDEASLTGQAPNAPRLDH